MNRIREWNRHRKMGKHMFLQVISFREKLRIQVCDYCHKPIHGDDLLYYCEECGSYFHYYCTVATTAGRVCPECAELQFLDRVVASR